jgi:hypothetical protein
MKNLREDPITIDDDPISVEDILSPAEAISIKIKSYTMDDVQGQHFCKPSTSTIDEAQDMHFRPSPHES